MSPSNALQLGAIFLTREKAEQALLSEQPPGHLIYPDHRVVEIRIEIVSDVA